MSSAQLELHEGPATYCGTLVAGRYRVLSRLGSGSRGAVYVAQQIGLDRRVAIKFIRRDRQTEPQVVERFRREARAVGRIESPHVVRVLDYADEDGVCYLAMELLDGETLQGRMRRGAPIRVPEALSLARQIASGLRAVHQARVVHRDLKPSNVFLVEGGGLKLLDFGTAKLLDEPKEHGLTQVNRAIGTPIYMSPEAAQALPVRETSDLYALGVMMFEMLVEAPPFRYSTITDTLYAQVEEVPPTLSQAAPWLAIPDGLESLVSSLLEKDPRRRPQNAEAVIEAIDRLSADLEADPAVSDDTVISSWTPPGHTLESAATWVGRSPKPEPVSGRKRRPAALHAWPARLGVLVVATALVALGVWMAQWVQ